MANNPHRLILMPNRSYQATVRSEIKKIAGATGFSAKRLAELEIVVAELTSNIVKHTASGAEFLVKPLPGDNAGIEIICIDAGPGMDSVTKMMEDGISSTKTLGQGFGAIKRLSDEFDAYSLKGWGTIVLSRMFNKKSTAPKKKNIEVGVVMVPKDGETACGDNYDHFIKGNHLKFAICDGLGHGANASIAAIECLKVFNENLALTPVEQIKAIHPEVKRTRGAVIYITHIDFVNRQMNYCGVGNISVKIQSSGKTRSCVSYNGIVGHSIPGSLNNHMIQWIKNDVLVIHSDGLSTRWDLQKYPFITRHDRSIIAAALYKDFCRKTDDVTIAVISQHNRTA